MKYKAELSGVMGLPKPVISHTTSEESIQDWINKVFEQYPPSKFPEARIIVYEEKIVPISIHHRASDENTIVHKTNL